MIRFFLKRTFSCLPFLLFLVLLIILPPAAMNAALGITPAPAGYFCEDSDPDALRVCKILDSGNLISYDSPEKLRTDVFSGDLDAGIIIRTGLSGALNSGETDGLLTVIRSPSSLYDGLVREKAAAALFEVYAPYITLHSLPEGMFTIENVRFETDMLAAGGSLFTFSVEHIDGKAPELVRPGNFFLWACGTLLLCGSFFGICIPLTRSAVHMTGRIGRKKAILFSLLPETVLRMLAFFAVSAAVMVRCGFSTLLPSTAAVLLADTLLGFVFCEINPSGHLASAAAAGIASVSAAVCPVFSDLSLYLPMVEKIRLFSPVQWMWCPFGKLIVIICITACGCAVSAVLSSVCRKLR